MCVVDIGQGEFKRGAFQVACAHRIVQQVDDHLALRSYRLGSETSLLWCATQWCANLANISVPIAVDAILSSGTRCHVLHCRQR